MSENNQSAQTKTHITNLAIGLAAGIISSVLVFIGTSDTNNSNELQTFIQQQVETNRNLMERVDKLEQENRALSEANALLTVEVAELKSERDRIANDVEVFESFIRNFPYPAWVKAPAQNGQFIMLVLNREYTATFGKTENEYVGKSDYDVYPPSIADQYTKADRQVLSSGESYIKHETIEINNKETQVTVVKFRVLLKDGNYGIAGFIIV